MAGLHNKILYYIILQYIVTNIIYCMIKSIAILYCCPEVLQYNVLLI